MTGCLPPVTRFWVFTGVTQLTSNVGTAGPTLASLAAKSSGTGEPLVAWPLFSCTRPRRGNGRGWLNPLDERSPAGPAMRVYQLLRLYRLAFWLWAAGLFVAVLGLAEILPEWALTAGVILFAVGFAVMYGLYWWLGGGGLRGLQICQSAEGPAVPPSDVPVEDATLEVGERLLAPWGGHWWRVVVVEVGPGDRVLVRYVGWDEIWEEPHRRRNLQRDVGAPPLPPEPIYWG